MNRRLATKLVRHAASVLPANLSKWGKAMQSEINCIESDRDALKWALGCVSASYLKRIKSLNPVKATAIRWALSLFVVSWAYGGLSSARLLYMKADAEELHPEILKFLEATPTWTLTAGVMGSVLYVAGAVGLAYKKMLSIPLLLGGALLSLIACVAQHVPSTPPIHSLQDYFLFLLKSSVIFLLYRHKSAFRKEAQ